METTQCCTFLFDENHYCPIVDLSAFLKNYQISSVKCKRIVGMEHVCVFACYKCGKVGAVHKDGDDANENGFQERCMTCNRVFFRNVFTLSSLKTRSVRKQSVL